MSTQFTYPGVYVQEIPSGVNPITGVATSITAFVGWAAQGPVNAGMLNVTIPLPISITISPSNPTVITTGGTRSFTATGVMSDGSASARTPRPPQGLKDHR